MSAPDARPGSPARRLGPALALGLALALVASGLTACSGSGGSGSSGPGEPGPGSSPTGEVPFTTAAPGPGPEPTAAPADDTFWVDPVAGSDQADGRAPARAWATLQHGFDQLGPGQTLLLRTGRYRGTIQPGQSHFVLRASGRPDAWIRVAAAPGEHPVVVAEAGNGIEIRGSYTEVRGLRIEGEGFGPANSYGWGLLVRGVHQVRVVANEVAGLPVGGITGIEATGLDIVGNTVHDNSFWGTEQGSGISLWHLRDAGTEPAADGYDNHVLGNVVYRNENKVPSRFRHPPVVTDGNGIIVDQTRDFHYRGRTLVANNLVLDNGGRAILVLESSRVDVAFNTTYRNGRTKGLEDGPVELAVGRSSEVRFLDNLAWARPGAPALATTESTRVASAGNVLVSDSQPHRPGPTDLVTGDDPGVLRADTDPTRADFRPVIGGVLAGRARSAGPVPALDATGRPRPASGADVGAFQQVSG